MITSDTQRRLKRLYGIQISGMKMQTWAQVAEDASIYFDKVAEIIGWAEEQLIPDADEAFDDDIKRAAKDLAAQCKKVRDTLANIEAYSKVQGE